ncbi:MAG: MmgE/PrpD family protein [Betaproteobacteria bacterium]|nr:MmgE/PrpD family protein [Betaproteobacteria bacterium]
MTLATADKQDHSKQTQLADNRYNREIAKFVSGLTYDRIPQEVRQRIKLLMLDSLGCGIYGSIKEHSRILMDVISTVDSTNRCGLWGSDKRVSAPHAALVNGALVQGFEIDDIHRQAAIHVGALTLPVIVAISELRPGMPGRRFMTAAVAGYEVGPRVGICMGPEHLGQGWHVGGTVGVFAAASSAASALGLSEDKAIHAMGIAGTQAAGLMAAQYGSMVKRMNHGRAAQSGLYGGLLAAAGFTGIENVFESDFGGFCTTFSRSTDRFNMVELTRDLGERWETMRDSLKFYSAAASNHTTLDAIRIMRARHPFKPQDVERIVVHGSQVTKHHVFWKYDPAAGLTNAQFCMPYVVATLLLEGDFFVDQVREDKLADPERIALSRKVEFIAEPEITATGLRYWVRVEIFLKDGTHMEEIVEAQRGSETKFATEADVVEKFEKLATHVFPAKQVHAIRDAVLGLDKLDDASKLAELLTAK